MLWVYYTAWVIGRTDVTSETKCRYKIFKLLDKLSYVSKKFEKY